MASREDYAKYISTASLLVAVAFMIGGVQSSGAILDTCNQGGMGITPFPTPSAETSGPPLQKWAP
jgi:hypothetical protein